MARKRMISPEIWESQNFSQLSDVAKIVFISLFSHADDEGRGRADSTFVKNITFPYDENRRVADIKQALSEIALRMSVQFYSVNGIEYYFMKNWERWQKVEKPSKSKFPAPPYVGVGGDMPNCDKFGEHSPTIPRTLPESSVTNRIEGNRKERNISSSLLSDKDYSELCAKLGKDTTDYYIERVKAFREKSPQATFSVKSTILKWQREDAAKEKQTVNPNSPYRIISDFSADELNRVFEKLNAEDL